MAERLTEAQLSRLERHAAGKLRFRAEWRALLLEVRERRAESSFYRPAAEVDQDMADVGKRLAALGDDLAVKRVASAARRAAERVDGPARAFGIALAEELEK